MLFHPPFYKVLCDGAFILPKHHIVAQDGDALFLVVLHEDIRQVIVLKYGFDGGHGERAGVRGDVLQHLHEGDEGHEFVWRGMVGGDPGDEGQLRDGAGLGGMVEWPIEGPSPAHLLGFDEGVWNVHILGIPDLHSIEFSQLVQQLQVLDLIFQFI